MILYVNACVREESRTNKIAKALLEKAGEYRELRLAECELPVLTAERLRQRDALIRQGNYDHEMFDYARQFAAADKVVIAAPFWDMSFPSILKQYLENICVTGITFRYGEDGRPQGLCAAKKLYYVTTAGGPLNPTFGYGYLEALAKGFFGITETELIKAEFLDIEGADAEEVVSQVIRNMKL